MGFFSAIAGPVLGSAVSGLFSSKQASDNRDFQQENSDTAYRRAVTDMRAAGLNPILAAKIGGASTPPGAMAQIPDLGASLNAGVNTALSSDRLDADVSKINAEIDKLVADKNLSEAQIDNVKMLTNRAQEEIILMSKQGLKLDYENIVNAIITEFKHENPKLTIMQAFGLDGRSLSNLINTVIGGGLLGRKKSGGINIINNMPKGN